MKIEVDNIEMEFTCSGNGISANLAVTINNHVNYIFNVGGLNFSEVNNIKKICTENNAALLFKEDNTLKDLCEFKMKYVPDNIINCVDKTNCDHTVQLDRSWAFPGMVSSHNVYHNIDGGV